MLVKANTLKWALRFYPPLFFQRIWVQEFAKDFTSARVKINRSLLNINYNKTIFGGTIFSASDPFYALLFDQVLRKRGFKTRVWLKSAQISYLKPGHGDLFFRILITEQDIAEAEEALKTVGKFVKSFPIEIKNIDGEICAIVNNEVYVRNLRSGETKNVSY